MRKLNKLKTLRNPRPCLDSESMLRVKEHFQNSVLSTDIRQSFVIPGRHALTPLIFLHKHEQAGHAGFVFTLMQTRQQCRSFVIWGPGANIHNGAPHF